MKPQQGPKPKSLGKIQYKDFAVEQGIDSIERDADVTFCSLHVKASQSVAAEADEEPTAMDIACSSRPPPAFDVHRI